MSPILSLILASAISSPEPTREHVQLLVAAIELHASIGNESHLSDAAHAAADPAFWYDYAAASTLDARTQSFETRITYTLASPVFRDLL